MASVAEIRELSALGRELGLSGSELNSFVTDRCSEAERRVREETERQREREEKEREERQAIERQKERDHELRMAQLRAEQPERQAQQPDFAGLRLKIGKFDESVDKFDSYITKFELMMESQKVPDQIRCLHLISNLTGRSLDIVNRMSNEDRAVYAMVKHELLEFFHLNEEGYRRKFRSARPEKGEHPKQFAVRMKGYFHKWVEMSDTADDFESLADLVLR